MVRTSATGLVKIKTHVRTMNKRFELVTRGVMDIKPGRPLYVTVENFQENSVQTPKRMNVAIEAEASKLMWGPNSRRK